MKTITIKDIVATARGTEILLPLLTGEASITDWAQSIAMDSVTTKNGREISAARSALNGAQFAMTNVAMALRTATELGRLPYTRAVQETNRIYNMLDGLRSAFAGVRNEAHRELTVAEVTLSVKDGVFDELQSSSDAYTREELEDLARAGSLDWEAIDEIMELQEAKQATGQADLMDSDGSWSESEGEFRTSVHTASQLWDMELTDIKYAESSAARVALIGMQWPTENAMWESLLDRLADAWEAGIEYADDKEAAAKKVERRESVVEDLFHNPTMARWVINHVTRRVFRDMAMLSLKAEEAQDRWDQAERQAFNEERFGTPAVMHRKGLGENTEVTRKAFLFYQEMDESVLGCSGDYAAMTSEGVTLRATANNGMTKAHKDGDVNQWSTMMQTHEEDTDSQLMRDRRWYMAQLETIEGLINKLRPLYTLLRTMDLDLSKLWELFGTGEMPASPPVYWNKEGPIFNEGDAHAAIRVEAAMAKQKAREAEGEALVKAAALVEQMLGL